MDAQGAQNVRPYVERANVTYTTLVDRADLLNRLFSFNAVPNGFLIDERGVLRYRKLGDFYIRKEEFASLVEV